MLKVYNTLSRKKEEFNSLVKDEVTFYHCGPTVYWTQHIGNMRAMVLADLVRRSLDYLGYEVKMVRNYTDVGHLTSDGDTGDDKMEKTAKAEKASPKEVANKYIKSFDNDVADLNVITPEETPKATDNVGEMKKMIKKLLDNGYAYETELAIYFDTSKFEKYGELSGQKPEDKLADTGKGEISDETKKNPADFAVWFFKAGVHENALQTWSNTPIKEEGEGFPGWHIECSAMSQKYLGVTQDLHMGGIEHMPVHHENEIAQSEAATGKKYVNYWLHNEHLTVDGSKMSKSEGTAYSLDEIKEKGYDPLVLRYFFLGAHYRSKQNFTWEALDGVKVALDKLRARVTELKKNKPGRISHEYQEQFTEVISDDFNSPQALAIIWDMLKSGIGENDKLATIMDFDKVLGLNLDKQNKIPQEVTKLANEREKARAEKNWEESDRLRDEIVKLGYQIDDGEGGYKIKQG
jgi:cysteinyl-tRNA synthetase